MFMYKQGRDICFPDVKPQNKNLKILFGFKADIV